jgi:hypothetical protein
MPNPLANAVSVVRPVNSKPGQFKNRRPNNIKNNQFRMIVYVLYIINSNIKQELPQVENIFFSLFS